MLNRSQSMTTMVLLSLFPIFSMGLISSIAQTIPAKPKPSDSHVAQPAAAATDWRETEKDTLAHQTQITFGDRFLKAGESYFSPDDKHLIFQAIETPPMGEAADEFYAMFVADVVRDVVTGRVAGIENLKRLSPKGSANTCGWFHPTQPNIVTFASTLTKPTESTPPGYQRASGRYKWMFPPEMRIVRCDLSKADGTAATLETIVGDGKAYCAEDSFSPDGRFLLYCSLESNEGDLFVLDTKSHKKTRVVHSKGYDGGPFFSPDGKRICYRSDRHGDSLLQLFVADLAFNEAGEIVGIQREYQLTDDGNVNWCPFFTPDGKRVVFATSAISHMNYEVFMCDADPGNLGGASGPTKYGTAMKRITNADGADVLPAFSHDGKTMVWTSKRGPDGESQLWVADVLFNPELSGAKSAPAQQPKPDSQTKRAIPSKESWIVEEDPKTGRVFVYDLDTHTLSEYNMQTHKLMEIDDQDLVDRFMELHAAHKQKDGEQ
jgi:TolB protein